MFYTSQIKNGWLHRNAGVNMVTLRTFNASECILMYRSGEMMYISALGKGLLIINSQRVAIDLLEKRSNIFSDRPHYISAGEFMTKYLAFSISPYDNLYEIYILSYVHADPI